MTYILSDLTFLPFPDILRQFFDLSLLYSYMTETTFSINTQRLTALSHAKSFQNSFEKVFTICCDMLYIFNDKTRWLRHTKIMTLHQMVSRRLLNYIWARSYATLFLNFSTFLPSFLNLHILILSKLTELLIRPH